MPGRRIVCYGRNMYRYGLRHASRGNRSRAKGPDVVCNKETEDKEVSRPVKF